MLCAVALFAVAAWLQHPGYQHGDVTTGGVAFSVAGLLTLTAGGWLGGTIVFVHGVRVLPADDPGPAEPGTTREGGDQAWSGLHSSRGS
jgi:uncharacterized membrane protein